ncbi:peroxiredoxin family protein [Undibacterium sp.]|uniref:peroxiredoxin family protein n=1 Tax=Undibacterium sp. TaxID=1914977 RepID=UPI00374CE80F
MNKRQFLQFTAGALCLGAYSSLQAQEPLELSLSGVDATGKKLALSDFPGHTVLVSFFTAGCNLCNHDLKLMREFYVRNAKRKFVLLAISLDDTKGDFEAYNKIIALSIPKEQRFPILWRNAPDYKDNFGTIAKQPTHFVLDKKRHVLLKREGSFQPNDWDMLWEWLEA